MSYPLPVPSNLGFTGVKKLNINAGSITAKTVNISETLDYTGNLQVQGNVGFYSGNVVAQAAAIPNCLTGSSANASDVATKVNLILQTLRNLNLIAS